MFWRKSPSYFCNSLNSSIWLTIRYLSRKTLETCGLKTTLMLHLLVSHCEDLQKYMQQRQVSSFLGASFCLPEFAAKKEANGASSWVKNGHHGQITLFGIWLHKYVWPLDRKEKAYRCVYIVTRIPTKFWFFPSEVDLLFMGQISELSLENLSTFLCCTVFHCFTVRHGRTKRGYPLGPETSCSWNQNIK